MGQQPQDPARPTDERLTRSGAIDRATLAWINRRLAAGKRLDRGMARRSALALTSVVFLAPMVLVTLKWIISDLHHSSRTNLPPGPSFYAVWGDQLSSVGFWAVVLPWFVAVLLYFCWLLNAVRRWLCVRYMLCRTCGYPLFENTNARCPECGVVAELSETESFLAAMEETEQAVREGRACRILPVFEIHFYNRDQRGLARFIPTRRRRLIRPDTIRFGLFDRRSERPPRDGKPG